MTDPMDHPPVDHGSDRYDYVEIIGAPVGIAPDGEWFDKLLDEACPDCRANVFITWTPVLTSAGRIDITASPWSVQIAHDEGCPTYRKVTQNDTPEATP